jgi:predicted transcriptional regulator
LGVSLKNIENELYRVLDSQISSSFNIKIVYRMLSTLMEHGRMNRTNLAGKTGLNYVRCVKYVQILLMLGWINQLFAGQDYLAITDKGREFVK